MTEPKPLTPNQIAFAKSLLKFGGMLRLPAKRDADLVPLPFERDELIATFTDHCNLGNLALPEERWKEFAKETREATDRWIGAVGLERHVRTQFQHTKDHEYGDIRKARMVVVARNSCDMMVPALHDRWWDELKARMKRNARDRGLPYAEPKGYHDAK